VKLKEGKYIFPVKKPPNKSVPSKFTIIFFMCMALLMFAMSLLAGPALIKGLITGQIYSLAVVFGSNIIVHRNSSPVEYWITMGFDLFGGIGMIVVSIATLILSGMELKRQIAEQKRKQTHR
jgi:predicted permease